MLFIVVVSCVLLAIVIVVNVLWHADWASIRQMKLLSSFVVEKESGKWHPDGKHSVPHIGDGMMVLPLMIFHQIQLMVCAGWRVDTNARPNSYRRSRKAAR